MELQSYFANLVAMAGEAIKAEDGDYIGDDGLLYCGKCQTKKQTRVVLLGHEIKPHCLCKCAIDKKESEDRRRKKIEFDKMVDTLRQDAFSGTEMVNWRFEYDDNSNAYISNVMHNYINNFNEMRKNGKGLMLFGGIGTGKSFMAACAANALVDQGIPCKMTNFSSLTNSIFRSYDKQSIIDDLNSYQLLVIDDLATERDTEYVNEIVFNIVDSRYRSRLPIIVTTNLTREQIKNPDNIRKSRVFSRLLEMTIPVEVKGDDRRIKSFRENYYVTRNILGI